MGSVGAKKVLLHIINVLLTLLGLGLAAAAIWFFIQVHDFTSLRNSNHYLLDYNVYWPQALPWMFFVLGVLVLCVSICGFTSAKKNSKGLLVMYIVFVGFVAFALIAAAVVALVCAHKKVTDDFVKDAVWDAYFESKTNRDVAEAYSVIERKLHCCGAESPRDYKNWKTEFPTSCCDTYYHGFLDAYTIDCQFTNKQANERLGCSTVASEYTGIIIKVLSGASVLTGVLGIAAIIVAIALMKGLKHKKSKKIAAQILSESQKGLL